MSFARAVLLALVGTVAAPSSVQSEHRAAGAVLFVSADLRGYLGPCGCSEAMRGGIDRAAFQIAEARRGDKTVLFIDGGDALFGRSSFSDAEIPQEERKAKAIANAFKLMGLRTRAVGELDDARGAGFRKSLGLPELESAIHWMEASGRRIAAVAARSNAELLEQSQRARERGADFIVGLLHRTIEQAQEVASDPKLQANLVFATHLPDELAGEENRLVRTPVPVVQVQSKGRSLARIEIAFGQSGGAFELQRTQADAERELAALEQRIELLKKELNAPGLGRPIKALKQGKLDELVKRRETVAAAGVPAPEGKNAFSVRFIPLESSLPSQPEVKALIARVDRDVGLLNLAWAKKHGKDCPAPRKGESAFVGSDSCRECHAESFPVWESSKHAHAYQTLADLGRQYDLDCVKCHVTGPDRPGGVCRVDKVEGRKDVSCESCHGPGSLHAQEPAKENILANPGKPDCVRCHNPENSSHFDFEIYLPQILGPGHGVAPASKE